MVILRPFNTFGPRQSARAIIPTIITQIISGKKRLDLEILIQEETSSYIDDTINLLFLKNKNIEGQIINLGTGFDFSIKEVATIISKQMSAKLSLFKINFYSVPKKLLQG